MPDTSLPYPRAVMLPVIQQHVEDAAFCWLRREDALWTPNHTVAHVRGLDNRMDANLEGIEYSAQGATTTTHQLSSIESGGPLDRHSMVQMKAAIEAKKETDIATLPGASTE